MTRISGEEPLAIIPSKPPDELRVQESVGSCSGDFALLAFVGILSTQTGENLMREVLSDALIQVLDEQGGRRRTFPLRRLVFLTSLAT